MKMNSIARHGLQSFAKTATRCLLVAFLIASAFLLLPAANAQLYTGSIAGTVTDSSGAAVPGAQVKATDADKGFEFTATSDSTGRYVIRQLPPARYVVSASASGFKSQRKEAITVEVNQNATEDFAMTVGAVAEVVDVRAGAVELQTQDAVTGQEINRTFLNNLPLVNRDAYDLVFLAPGLVHTNADTGNATGVNFNSAGSRNSTAEVLVDGATATNVDQNTGINGVLYEPPVDAIQEFKVQQSNFSSEFGFAGSTIINLVTRSGTNDFHGSLHEFWRNEILDANDWFSDQAGSPIPALRRNQFGGTIGGPIKKNKTFFFFDYEGIRQHSANSNTFGVPTPCERGDVSANCPFAAAHGGNALGDFEDICTLQGFSFNGSGVCSDPSGQLWDPYTGVFDNAGCPNTCDDPFGAGSKRGAFIPFNNLATYMSPGNPGNGAVLPAVPGNLIDPLAANLLTLFPEPNQAIGDLSGAQNNNFFVNGVNTDSEDKFDIKIDHRFNDKNLLSAKYSKWNSLGHSLNCFGNFADPCTGGPSTLRHQVFSLNYARNMKSNLLLSLTYGYLRGFDFAKGVGADFSNFDSLLSGIGVPSSLEQTGFEAVPFISLTSGNYNTSIGGQPFAILREGQDTHYLQGALSWLRGQHEFKFGGEWRVHRINFVQPGWPAGEFDFDFTATSQFANASDTTTGGDDLASFLMGVGPPSNSAGGGCTPCFSGFDEFVSTQSFSYAAFFQDNYRVSPKLTLNLGLRYEINTPRTERYNKMDWLNPNLVSPIQFASQPTLAAPLPPGASIPTTLHGGEEFVGVGGNSRSNYYTDYKDIQPRIGFAYQLPHESVVRGGYGIFFTTPRNVASGTGPWGFQGFDVQPPWITVHLNNVNDRTPCCTLSNPAPNGVPQPPGSAFGALNDVGFAAVGPVPSISQNTPYEQVWSLGVEKNLPGKMLLDAEYLGKKGTHLYLGGFRELNFLGPWVEKLTPGQIQNLTINDQDNPFFCPAAPCPSSNFITDPNSGLSASQIARYQLMLPYPQFTGFQQDSPPISSSIYHALQLRVEKEFSSGLQFLVSYTFSKSIDDASATDDSISWLGGGTVDGSTLGVQDPNNLKPERAVSVFDIPHDLQFSYVYALPIGRGKHFAANMHPVLDAVVGGWQTAGNWVFQSGRPIIPLQPEGSNPIPTYGQRPTLTAPLRRSSNSPESVTAGSCSLLPSQCPNYFANPDALQQTTDFTLGNSPRTITTVRQPGTQIVSLSLFKEFPLASVREGMRLEFRAEAFNAFNHPQFAGPSSTANTSDFGVISSLVGPPRQVQLGLKLYF
jgi:Carboxypeptidase regulatory-like domain/TonB dependent receptor